MFMELRIDLRLYINPTTSLNFELLEHTQVLSGLVASKFGI